MKETTEREKTLTINEIYHSIQGESTWAGEPCVFVRLTFCDLRCNYCDTEYAFYEGKKQTLRKSSRRWRRSNVRSWRSPEASRCCRKMCCRS